MGRKLALLPVALVALTGCQTAPPMAPVDLSQPGWSVKTGQLLWLPQLGAPEIAGHILLASDSSGETFIRFSKEPMEIVLARQTAAGWDLQIPAFEKSYGGRGQPPKRIAWFQLAAAVFGGSTSRDWQWQDQSANRWTLVNSKTGERLEGFFTR